MFGKKKKVLSDGVQAEAVILEARPGNLLSPYGERKWRVEIRVHYQDGQTADVTCGYFDLTSHTIGDAVGGIEPYPMSPGVVLPVRYDPADRAKVEIDRPKIIADTISAYETKRAKKIERAEQQLARGGPAPQNKEDDEGLIEKLLSAEEQK